jgi:hypothetical protein
MKLMLTSFGIEERSAPVRGESMFHRMPPVSFRRISEAFMPDYELLVLCDQVVMDESSFQQLIDSPARAYSGVAETFRALKAEGRIELVDFSSVLRANSDLLDKMLDHDMSVLDQWVVPLRDSLATWAQFSEMSMQVLREGRELLHTQSSQDAGFTGLSLHTAAPYRFSESDLQYAEYMRPALLHEIAHVMHSARRDAYYLSEMVEDALRSAEKRRHKEYRSALREVLQSYLAYVNANLVLASELNIPFHDWLDFTPFYSMKFLSVGKLEDDTQKGRKQVERLFTVAFPELAIQDTSALLKVLNDKRIQDLRQLIGDAVLGKVQFDEHFAKSVLAEVLRSERKVTRFRNILGYVTLPIGFIPGIGTPAQKVVEEAIGLPVAKKMKQKHRWFYMLSEIADSRAGATNSTE